ncbi:MAG: phosphoenolpyruvate synthase [Planctomycetales bacterium]|nr:phosphoenolpyruvate synthase [Planctomycetales bacterium]NIM08744.1 phosphoenolpyruvate synthase [Planctomycetales bacterium]NIN08212.1 phosphoenolpyruvate synthase [Planctomycetales bacterium]NIN77340.1 phosphoenolpyruvate synthase [Planctomycetales bacterium]NIO34524.1 phosphoenolpyruvate synthase [Planctomycetales bacterium]
MVEQSIRWFDQIGLADVAEVGGKNASLGEMVRQLSPQGIRVPGGFAITAAAYRWFLQRAGLQELVRDVLSGLDTNDVPDLQRRGSRIRHAIQAADYPDDLRRDILRAYEQLSGLPGEPVDVAVRSSATAEDLPDASFAGQQETYLNVRGGAALLDACRRCFASLFTDRAISYRVDKGFPHDQIALSVGVQRMVRSDLATSGVMFSIDTESGFRQAVLINAAYGLGENVVQGSVNPDEYYVFKPTLSAGFRPILKRTLGSKEFKLVYDVGGSKMVKNVPVAPEDRARFALEIDEILTLARWACTIEDHYSKLRGRYTPMDMEWAKDGRSGELFIVQARPETVHSQKAMDVLETYHLKQAGRLLVSGRSVGEKIGQGPVQVIQQVDQLEKFQAGEVLVTDKTDPDWEPVMKNAAAIVTNRGGRTCHAAIVSRELGLPAIVGAEKATEVLSSGQQVTVSCAEGDLGHVYEGQLDYEIERIPLGTLRRPRTKIMMNVANPDEAFRLSLIPNDGVGLARMEFIINTYIQIHPLALLEFDQLEDAALKNQIDQLTVGYRDKPQFFIDTLAEGVAMIAAAFYPRDVIVRLSDFKSNEYANLIGGRGYEPVEENPMIGFRGAARYYDPRFRNAFGLECAALKKVREVMGLKNVKLMIPFCRTVEEGRRVQEVMAAHGLQRGAEGLEIYVMCELPSNVVSAAEFAEIFDGFSIGSNDLTQLILGVDRDSEIVAPVFDERDPAVMRSIAAAITAAHDAGRKIGICGQAPSDYPEFAEFLVAQGIDSISLNPDAVLKTTLRILELEGNN